MKRILSLILSTAVCLSVLTGCGGNPSNNPTQPSGSGTPSGAGKVYEWDWLMTGGNTLMTQIAKEMAAEIETATDGQLKITVRVSGELPFAVSEYLQTVSDGSAAMADCLLSAISNDLSSGALIALPMLINDFDDLNTAMDVLSDRITTELSSHGVRLAGYYSFPGQQVWGTGKVPATIADLKGMKVRAQGSEQAAWLEMNGLTPVTVNASEVTTSVSRGIIDGIVTAAQSLPGENWYEVVDWGYICNMQYIGVYTVVNEAALNELPEDVRNTYLEIAEKYSTEIYPQRVGDYDIEAKKECEELGLTLVYAPEEERAAQIEQIKSYWAEWCQEKGGTTAEDLEAILAALN